MFEQEGTSTAPAPEVAAPESSDPGAPTSTEVEGEAPAAPAPVAAPAGGADESAESEPAAADSGPTFGGTDADGEYQPMQVVSDDLGGMSFADAISGTIVEFDEGDIVTGTVVKVDKDEVLLDIGYKSEGVIPNRELSIRHDVDPHEVVATGDVIEALVLQKEDKEGRLILSKKRAQYERAWGTIEQIKQTDGVVEGPVIEVVKGGLILDIGLRGFLPASLVELRRVRDLQPYVGRTLQAKIIELDKNRNNVVLSRRAHLEETQREARDEFLANLKPGEVRRGVVSSVVNFGAFVDLGGMDGLVHVSELSWKHVDHPSSVVQVGDEVTVQVLDVDLSRERISLSLKATQQDPWQQFASGHRVGELVYGRVTKLVPFGAFVQVGEGIEGLVHISEMAAHHVDLPDQVVSPGEELWVKIIDLDLERRRISLSIKQAAEGGTVAAEYQDLYGEHAYDEQGNYIGPDYVGEEGAAAAEGEEGAAAADAADAPEGSASEEAPVAAAAEEAPVASAPEAPADEVAGDEGEVSPA
ncbi:MAG: small subunit ribosomal protein [Actinomycetota bacterium]|nr:small subunit ribosomal protein [Actinomycetota bacterium]